MPYTVDESRLYALIERALDTEEIKGSLNKVPLDRETLRKSVAENANQIWEEAMEEIAEYDLLEMRIKKSGEKPPAFFKPLVLIYRLLRSVFQPGNDVDSRMREKLEVARLKADEALIQSGIIPQLRSIINKAYWR